MTTRQTTLQNIASVGSGAGFPIKYQGEPTGDYPFYKVSDMNTAGNEMHMGRSNNYISEDVRQKLRAKIFSPGSIIFPKIGAAIATNKKRLLTKPSCIDNNVMAVTPIIDQVLPEFLYYLFQSKNLSDFASDADPPSMKKTTVEAFAFLLPSLKEQRRIVDILNHAASIRRLRDEAQKTARETIPALFVKMFGDPATNPKGWEVVSVGDVLSAADYGTSKKALEGGDGIPVLRMGNVRVDGSLDLGRLKYVELDDRDLAKYRLQAGDILFNRTNSKELVGKTGLWDGRYEAVAASYFIRLRANQDVAHPTYVWAFFNTTQMKRRLFETARGAIGQANINAREVKGFSIPLPPQEIQQQFHDRHSDLASVIRLSEGAGDAADKVELSLLGQTFQ